MELAAELGLQLQGAPSPDVSTQHLFEYWLDWLADGRPRLQKLHLEFITRYEATTKRVAESRQTVERNTPRVLPELVLPPKPSAVVRVGSGRNVPTKGGALAVENPPVLPELVLPPKPSETVRVDSGRRVQKPAHVYALELRRWRARVGELEELHAVRVAELEELHAAELGRWRARVAELEEARAVEAQRLAGEDARVRERIEDDLVREQRQMAALEQVFPTFRKLHRSLQFAAARPRILPKLTPA